MSRVCVCMYTHVICGVYVSFCVYDGLCVINVSVSSIYSICLLLVHCVVQFVYYMGMRYVCHCIWCGVCVCVCVCCLVTYACVVSAVENGIVW